MMQHFSAGGIICRTLGLALLGVVAVSTASVVVPVLACAVLGYGIYGVFLYLWSGKWPQGWEKIPGFCKTTVKRTWQVLAWPVGKLYQLVVFLLTGVFRLTWGSVKLSWNVTTEMLADAILGAAIGVLISIPMHMDQHTGRVAVATGAACGGLFGLWSGFRRWRKSGNQDIPVLTPLHQDVKPPVLVPVPAAPAQQRRLLEA
jgi:hypothetical protein